MARQPCFLPSLILGFLLILLQLSPFPGFASTQCPDDSLKNAIKSRLGKKSKLEILKSLQHIHARFGLGPSIYDIASHPKNLAKSKMSSEELNDHVTNIICESFYRSSEDHQQAAKLVRSAFPKLVKFNPVQLHQEIRNRGQNADKKYFEFHQVVYDLQIASAFLPSVYTPGISFLGRQRQFWLNHFNVEIADKGAYAHFGPYIDIVDQNSNSTFYDLLLATSKSPAMLIYLDNISNHKPSLNLNYARELIELHTLGARPSENIYTQKDIEAAAKILSGWQIEAPNQKSFIATFNENQHFPGAKKAFGKTFSTGEAGYQEFLQFLASHPRTKSNICQKLQIFYFGSIISSKITQECTSLWGSKGNLKAIYKFFLLHPETWKEENQFKLVKSPLELVLTLLRSIEIENHREFFHLAQNFLKSTHQASGKIPNPNGYSFLSTDWQAPYFQLRWLVFKVQISRNKTTKAIHFQDRRSDLSLSSLNDAEFFSRINEVNSPLFLVK